MDGQVRVLFVLLQLYGLCNQSNQILFSAEYQFQPLNNMTAQS